MDHKKVVTDLSQVVATEVENFSDGYHTFRDLYDHRVSLFAALVNQWCKTTDWDIHKSWKHNEGLPCFGSGWFIVMAETPHGQVSYHFEDTFWDLFCIPEKEYANKWDGHTPEDVVARLQACAKTEVTSPVLTCKVTGSNLSTEKRYSEKDISEYLRNFLRRSLSGDSFSDSPWGEEVNKQLYVAIFTLPDLDYGIKSATRRMHEN
jgi:hypothetical protein